MSEPTSLIDAIRERNLFVSVRKNRYFQTRASSSRLRLVLNITGKKELIDGLRATIETRFSEHDISTLISESHGVGYLLVYCRDTEVLRELLAQLQGYPLRSSTHYNETTNEISLLEKASRLVATMV